jgi:hypothetical protein
MPKNTHMNIQVIHLLYYITLSTLWHQDQLQIQLHFWNQHQHGSNHIQTTRKLYVTTIIHLPIIFPMVSAMLHMLWLEESAPRD